MRRRNVLASVPFALLGLLKLPKQLQAEGKVRRPKRLIGKRLIRKRLVVGKEGLHLDHCRLENCEVIIPKKSGGMLRVDECSLSKTRVRFRRRGLDDGFYFFAAKGCMFQMEPGQEIIWRATGRQF